MSPKLKLFLILLFSIFASAATGIYLTQHQSHPLITSPGKGEQQPLSVAQNSSELLTDPERSRYKTIPLESINSILQGSDPATLALSALDDMPEMSGLRKVEVSYPQRNLALVTITQIQQDDKRTVRGVKYRVEMSSFGRSLLVSSPPVWQIVWAGYQQFGKQGSRGAEGQGGRGAG
ncbi:MAG TPA: hypothetical protein VK203_12675, partial [Nostocaceae cyanobacterium]|nr:hypothetical protein [Nostocaceae cyanobacterium]